MQVRELRTMSINVPWLEVLKACYPNAQVIMVTMMNITVTMLMIMVPAYSHQSYSHLVGICHNDERWEYDTVRFPPCKNLSSIYR